MYPLACAEVYRTPVEYKPPDDADLPLNTEYPNLNSRDYARRPLNRNNRMHETWECISLDGYGSAAIGINKLSGREWIGSLWGFECLDALTADKSCYRLQCIALISSIKFMSKNILLVALQSGDLQVWSTYSEARNSTNPYCLFLVGERCEYNTPITAMDILKTCTKKAVAGSKDGTLKIWDSSAADLVSTHTYRFAHTDAITGIDSSYADESIIATCSLDKSSLLWDNRQTMPAIAIYENHRIRFRSVAFSSSTDAAKTLLLLGDEAGWLHNVDLRMPHKFTKSTQVLDRPIRKLSLNTKHLAIIGDTNTVKICNQEDHIELYKNEESRNFVRDAVWLNPNELLTVGYEGKLRRHELN